MKTHYVYEIVNKINFKRYIGVRTCKGNPEDDIFYWGSSSYVNCDLRIFGVENFSKEILKIFETRIKAEEYEQILLHKYDVLRNDKFYNLALNGKNGLVISSNKGMVTTASGKKVATEEFRARGLKGVNYGKRMMCNTKLNKNKMVNPDEILKYKKEGWKLGKLKFDTVLITNGIKNKIIIPKDLDHYIGLGWVKGRTNFKKHKKYYTNGIETKAFEENEQPAGWINGKHYCNTKNTVSLYKGRKKKYINENEIDQYLGDGWKLGTPSRTWMYLNEEEIFILDDEVEKRLSAGWLLGKNKTGNKNNLKGRIKINDGEKTKLIFKSELDIFLEMGWKKGGLKGLKRKIANLLRI